MIFSLSCTILYLQVVTDFGLKYANDVLRTIESGEEKPVQSLLEQWLREGKMSDKEAMMSSTSMFAAGVDTVSFYQITLFLQSLVII